MNNDKILNNAKEMGEKWLDTITFNGTGNSDKVKTILSKRTFNGKPITTYVVNSCKEAVKLVHQLINNSDLNAKQKKELQPWSCIWDYYDMAFWDCAYSQCPDQSHEFGSQSFLEACKHGLGYYINLGSVAIGIMRPEAHVDMEQRIHNPQGPAIVWGDEKQYWWRGVKVPEKWITDPDSVDPKDALTWENMEQRAALCEILGWGKILKTLNPKVIDTDPDPEIGELLEVDIPDAPGSKFLRVLCGTGREFCLAVPPDMKTALQANAWSWGLDKEEYKPEVRT